MSPAEALIASRAAGMRIGIDGDDLTLEAPTAAPPALLDLLSHQGRRDRASSRWPRWLVRSGLASLFRRMGRDHRVRRRLTAKRSRGRRLRLLRRLMAQPQSGAVATGPMLGLRPGRAFTRSASSPSIAASSHGSTAIRCVATGPMLGLRPGRAFTLPFGTESSGHAWLHSRCRPAWHASRKADAVAALGQLGITTSRTNQ
jgi:hypothetical protein